MQKTVENYASIKLRKGTLSNVSWLIWKKLHKNIFALVWQIGQPTFLSHSQMLNAYGNH
jgi:hypothetical protein